MTSHRHTVRNTAAFEGLGLHSGKPVQMRVHPGEAGILFRFGRETVLATPENVTDTRRSTTLGPVHTIEHLMSAFAALEITDAEVELTEDELPGMDGSAAPFYRGLLETGLEASGEFESPELFSRLFLQEDGGLKLAVGKGEGHWRFVYDLNGRWPNQQAFECADVASCYGEQIAEARTLVLAEEIPHVKALGLGKGLDESSVLIVGTQGYENEARFPDEPARHKLLDLIGDLYLSGVPIKALNVVAERSGHRANVQMAARLKQAVSTPASG